MLDYPPPYCAPHADTFLGIRILNGFCQESKIFKVLNFCRVLTQSFLLLLVSWRSRSRRSAWDSQHRSDYGQCPLSEVCLVKIRDSNSGWDAKLSLLRQVRVEHPNNFIKSFSSYCSTVGIWLLVLQLPETCSYQNFTSSLTELLWPFGYRTFSLVTKWWPE